MNRKTDFAELLQMYPETISKEQMYQICGISKRTCRYLLESGLVPCVDTGRRTHRFHVKMKDVIAYLQEREIHPEQFRPPTGYYYIRQKKKSAYDRLTEEQLQAMRDYYTALLEKDPDVVTVETVVRITGYSHTRVDHWCLKKKIKCFKIRNRYRIPKEYLLDFLTGRYYFGIMEKSGQIF